MSSHTNGNQFPISPDLLEILRDPQAIQERALYGSDPGRLELVHNSWLVSADTGYKYPIRDGIPVMLIEEGARWKDTPVDQLPVPPPAAEPAPATRAPENQAAPSGANPDYRVLLGVAAVFLILLGLVSWWRKQGTIPGDPPPPAA